MPTAKEQEQGEPLTLNISEFGSATLIKAARIRNDSRMLLHIDGRDTIAMEIKYHRYDRAQYKNYVNPKQLVKLEEQNCQEEDDETEGYNRTFDKIKEKEVFAAAKAIPISVLAENTLSFLQKKE